MKASLPSWLSGLLVLCAFPLFFLGGPDWVSLTVIKNVWDFGHIIFFAVLTLLLQTFRSFATWRSWLMLTMVILVLGLSIEALQYFVGRNASWNDVFHNVCGMWLGLFWGQKPTRWVWSLRAASVALLLPALWLVIDSAMTDVSMRYQFPQLNSFESRYEMQQLRFNPQHMSATLSTEQLTHGQSSLLLTFSPQPYAGVRLLGPYGDWGKYSSLAMDFFNPANETVELAIKISDYRHDRGINKFNDRFNRRVELLPGWNSVNVTLDDIRTAPYKREMQMDQISGFGIFIVNSPVERRLYWDNIRLQ